MQFHWHDIQQQMSMYELQTHSFPAMLCFTAPAPPAHELMKPMDFFFFNSTFPPLYLSLLQ